MRKNRVKTNKKDFKRKKYHDALISVNILTSKVKKIKPSPGLQIIECGEVWFK